MSATNSGDWEARLNSPDFVAVLNALTEVADHGDLSHLPLLQSAGANAPDLAKRLPITLPEGKFTFEQYRERCLQRLKDRFETVPLRPAPHTSGNPRLFISYNHRDREAANKLALELSRAGVNVFIDHWELATTDRILDRIERELSAADYVVVLLSPRSMASSWVQTELKYAFLRQEQEGRAFLIPVQLEDCNLPPDIAARPYHDYRDESKHAAVIQAITNQVRGIRPFSQRVKERLAKPDPDSPYTQKAQSDCQRLLMEVAKYPEMEIANNQRWLMWELYHELLPRYACTMKVGPAQQHESESGVTFRLVDRWTRNAVGATLTDQELARGLWAGELDLLKSGMFSGGQLKNLGRTGRLSWNSANTPHTDANPAEPTARETVARIQQELRRIWEPFSDGSRQCLVFEFQKLIHPTDWHKIRIVVGAAPCDLTLAYSNMVRDDGSQQSRDGIVFELYDPFFASLKATQLYRSQLAHQWEGDVDLMAPEWETMLGLA